VAAGGVFGVMRDDASARNKNPRMMKMNRVVMIKSHVSNANLSHWKCATIMTWGLVNAQLVEAVIGILSVRTIKPTKALLTKMKTNAVAFNEYNSN
jgi:hypothetical protein